MRVLSLITALAVSLSASVATAADETPLTCAQLGYTKPASECGDRKKIACPYDSTKYFCPGEESDSMCTPSLKPACNALFDGPGNTDRLIEDFGDVALAASAARKFYPSGYQSHPVFGQGRWYLPAAGELVDVYFTEITTNLRELYEDLGRSNYLSFSSFKTHSSTIAKQGDTDYQAYKSDGKGKVSLEQSMWHYNGNNNSLVFPFLKLTGCFNANTTKPKVGDLMLGNNKWVDPDDYLRGLYQNVDIIGIVVKVSEQREEFTIMATNGLDSANGNCGKEVFNPEDPFIDYQNLGLCFFNCYRDCPTDFSNYSSFNFDFDEALSDPNCQ